jgi:RHS repeat-associated protein
MVDGDNNEVVGRQQGRNFAGMYYTLHRHYDPILMRFTSPDPLAAPFYNLYHYTGNSPFGYFDPDGLISFRIPFTETHVRITTEGYWDRATNLWTDVAETARDAGVGMLYGALNFKTMGVFGMLVDGDDFASLFGADGSSFAFQAAAIATEVVSMVAVTVATAGAGASVGVGRLATRAVVASTKAAAKGAAKTTARTASRSAGKLGALDGGPGATTRATRKQFRQFKKAVEELGGRVRGSSRRLTTRQKKMTHKPYVRDRDVFVNRKSLTQQQMIDEYSHLWNNVHGRGQNLAAAPLRDLHRNLGEVATRDGTKALGSRETLFHQLELANMLGAGHRPAFMQGMSRMELSRYLARIPSIP